MSDRPSHNLGGLDIDLARRIDEICRRFEAGCREGSRPRIENYLGEVPDEGRPALRAELIALEHELCPSDATVARPEAGPPTAHERQTAPSRSRIAEAPTIAPGPPPTSPIPDTACPAVHEQVTLPHNSPPQSPHDQPTAAVLGQDPSATLGAADTTRIRYFGDYEITMRLLTCLSVVVVVAVLPGLTSRAADDKAKPQPDSEYVRKMIPTSVTGTYHGGGLIVMRVHDRNAYIVKPTGKADPQRRWVWIFPFWLGINDGHGRLHHRLYVEKLLAAGFRVAGVDVGTSCGSPAAAEVCKDLVPMSANSTALANRYKALDGSAEVVVIPGLGHGGQVFYESQPLLEFLLAD